MRFWGGGGRGEEGGGCTVSPRVQQNARLFGHFWRQLVLPPSLSLSPSLTDEHNVRSTCPRDSTSRVSRRIARLYRAVSASVWLKLGRQGGGTHGSRRRCIRMAAAARIGRVRSFRRPEARGARGGWRARGRGGVGACGLRWRRGGARGAGGAGALWCGVVWRGGQGMDGCPYSSCTYRGWAGRGMAGRIRTVSVGLWTWRWEYCGWSIGGWRC